MQIYPAYAYAVLTYDMTGIITHTHTNRGKLKIAQRDKKHCGISDLSTPVVVGGFAQPKRLGMGKEGEILWVSMLCEGDV